MRVWVRQISIVKYTQQPPPYMVFFNQKIPFLKIKKLFFFFKNIRKHKNRGAKCKIRWIWTWVSLTVLFSPKSHHWHSQKPPLFILKTVVIVVGGFCYNNMSSRFVLLTHACWYASLWHKGCNSHMFVSIDSCGSSLSC